MLKKILCILFYLLICISSFSEVSAQLGYTFSTPYTFKETNIYSGQVYENQGNGTEYLYGKVEYYIKNRIIQPGIGVALEPEERAKDHYRIPSYLTIKINTGEDIRNNIYLVGKLGSFSFYNTESKTNSLGLFKGIYYGAGIGARLNKTVLELLYSVEKYEFEAELIFYGKHKFEVTKPKISINAGIIF